MKKRSRTAQSIESAQTRWGTLSDSALAQLVELIDRYGLSVDSGDLLQLEGRWYVTHSGLLGIARRKRCSGIQVQPALKFCDPPAARWAFKATVYKSRTCKGFVGYGDADPSNVSPLVHGAEMRVAETRAVNRACARPTASASARSRNSVRSRKPQGPTPDPKKLPPQRVNGKSWNNGPKVRDQLCQIIRQHQLDPTLVKAYAVDFCGTKTLREATREQVENFLHHLADWAEKDRNALLCQLNSYPRIDNVTTEKEGAA